MIKFYRERRKPGDYLCIDTDIPIRDGRGYEGRATMLGGVPESMHTTGISREYLRNSCRRIRREDVPKRYLNRMI